MEIFVRLKKAIAGFSLDVEWEMDNEIAVLFGFSGSGKTMTFQMIAGLTMPEEGLVRFGGSTFYDSAAGVCVHPQKRGLGYVFQDLALFPHMTVAQNILYGSEGLSKMEGRRYAQEMMDIFQISGLGKRYPHEISGGQKQRVALARALAGRPSALLLDEPFSALDYPIRVEMRKLLAGIRKEFSIPVVLITHDLDEACSMADRMIVYAEGKVAQSGAPAEILSSPATPAVRRLLGRDPVDDSRNVLGRISPEIKRSREERAKLFGRMRKAAFSQK
jgi:molybdate transport system ATP-binding protein